MTGLSFTSRIEGFGPDLEAKHRMRAGTSATARSLALAHYIEDGIESRAYRSASEVAAALGVTRARISQITALLRLAPVIQEQILPSEDLRNTRALRSVCAESS